MRSTVTRIIETFNAPESTVKTAWEDTEAKLQTALPNDYKELIDRMGGGYIEEYMHILEPNCRNKHYDLVDMTDERTEANEMMWDIEEKPPELQIEGCFVIPWATTDNGEYLFWRCLPGQHPDEWTVLVNQGRDWTWEHHDMNCTEFLFATLTKEIRSKILYDDFPLARHVFARFTPKEFTRPRGTLRERFARRS
ncbi:hypothetical protein N7532_001857 [Penicillium argentinense]|uniref:Knr4/Smi1-like domain-containing protein n=1 Tax=Penicillium argentinense TaxID=1131581 RepID=A0A9W9G4X0_9EURO|nr:uncharacterized protein N7532_001857 [Penicillium argentinense]KAJ5111322.1 hypothetical protein N7532_001857 [Penicillium argentinense]